MVNYKIILWTRSRGANRVFTIATLAALTLPFTTLITACGPQSSYRTQAPTGAEGTARTSGTSPTATADGGVVIAEQAPARVAPPVPVTDAPPTAAPSGLTPTPRKANPGAQAGQGTAGQGTEGRKAGGNNAQTPAINPTQAAPTASLAHALQLQFEAGVPQDRKQALIEAVTSFYSLPITIVDDALSQMMKVQNLAPETLQSWLEERVQYVVNNDFDLQTHAGFSTSAFSYPFGTSIPWAVQVQNANLPQNQIGNQSEDGRILASLDVPLASPLGHKITPAPGAPVSPDAKPADNKAAQVMMLNLGAGLYWAGKSNGKLVTMSLEGIGDINFTSPRVGLLEIGPGLFPNLQGKTVQDVALDIIRVSTLMHEARHSDGHAESLGFLHVICPQGHDYAGLAACDAAQNGPYTVGAMIQLDLLKSCTQCSAASQQMLKVMYADVADRVITLPHSQHSGSVVSAPNVWDDSPEGSR